MTGPLHNATLRFWRGEGAGRAVAGTGFLAAGADGKAYALTCAHVADQVFRPKSGAGGALTSGTTTADLFGGRQVELDLVDWRAPVPVGAVRSDPVADIAVFSVREPFVPPFMPRLRLDLPERVVRPGHRVPFHTFGYMGTDNGLPAGGTLSATDAGGWFVADGDRGFRRFIEEGLSGAPAHANGVVLGMVTQRLELSAKQGFVIPALWLAKAWPPLAEPYPGLPAFDAANSYLYFGRGRPLNDGGPPSGKIKQVIDRLEAQRFVAVLGASGSGKSSLARAGVAPLYERNGWAACIFRPGLRPIEAFAGAIVEAIQNIPPGPERLDAAKTWTDRLENGRLDVALDLAQQRGVTGVLIVIDQFEEFFTSGGERDVEIARQRRVLLPQLRGAADRPDVRCLLTARLDLIERMIGSDPDAREILSDTARLEIVTAMSPAEVRQAVEGPASLFGVTVEREFADDLAKETARDEGRLPLLQAALRSAWSRIARDGKQWWLRRPPQSDGKAPETILDDELSIRANEAFIVLRKGTALSPGLPEQDLRRVLLSVVRLVDGKPTRRLISRADASQADWAICEALAVERLVKIDGEEGTAELVHESLMTRWDKLREWIAGERNHLLWLDRFERELATWRERGEMNEDLLRPQDVAIALNWLDNPNTGRIGPSNIQASFIRGSDAFHRAESRRQQQLIDDQKQLLHEKEHLLRSQSNLLADKENLLSLSVSSLRTARTRLVVAGVALLLAAVAGAWGRNELQQQRSELAEAQFQESRALASLAQEQSAKGDQGTAILLSLEALPDPAFGGDRRISPDAAAALRQSWLRNNELAVLSHAVSVRTVAFSPDGRRVVTASGDHSARVWDLSGAKPVATVLEGHTGSVISAAFSPDGQHVVTASGDHTARVWNLSGAKPVATVLEGHTGSVISAAFSPDGQHVVTTSDDHTARVWDLSGAKPFAIVLEGHTGPVISAAFSRDGRRVITASWDHTARVWDFSGAKPVATVLAGHNGPVLSVGFSADGRRAVTGCGDRTARVWDLSGAKPVSTVLEGHTGSVTSAAFSPNGRNVVTASDDHTARVWDLSGAKPVATVLEGHTGQVFSAAISPDGRRVVTASWDHTARVWDLSDAKPVATVLDGHTDAVVLAAFSPDGLRVVTASWDHTARVWDLSGAKPATVLEGHAAAVLSAAFSPDGRRVVTASWDKTARVWELSGAKPVATVLEGDTGPVYSAAFSPDGQRVVTASWDQTARVWDLSGVAPVATVLEAHAGPIISAAFSSDGRRVVTASAGTTARVWDLSGARPVASVLEGRTNSVHSAAFSLDGRRVVIASSDHTARVWDLSGAKPVAILLEGHTDGVTSAAFSPDGRRVVTASDDGTARVWDLSGAKPVATILEGHTGPVYSAAFSPDGMHVVTASADNMALVWDLSGAKPVATVLEGHTGGVNSAAFSRDGRRVVTASDDGTARVWDLSGDKPVATVLEGHTGPVYLAAFSPDGRRVVTASADKTARVWETYPDIAELSRTAVAKLPRCLSVAQRERFGLQVTSREQDRETVPVPDPQGHCPR